MIYLILALLCQDPGKAQEVTRLESPKDLITIDPLDWLYYMDDGCAHGFEDIEKQYPFLLNWYVDEIYYIYFKSVRIKVNSGSFFDSSIDVAENWA